MRSSAQMTIALFYLPFLCTCTCTHPLTFSHTPLGCSHSCRDRGKLSEHVRVHTAEKVVACSSCGSLFSNNTKLKDHLNRQAEPSGDPSHTCSFCNKGFSNERLLREHTRGHINTVKCPHCDLTCQCEFCQLTHSLLHVHDCLVPRPHPFARVRG